MAPFCVKKAKPTPSLKSGVRYTGTEKISNFLFWTISDKGTLNFGNALLCATLWIQNDNAKKVEKRAKKFENFEVARVIVTKIV